MIMNMKTTNLEWEKQARVEVEVGLELEGGGCLSARLDGSVRSHPPPFFAKDVKEKYYSYVCERVSFNCNVPSKPDCRAVLV